MISDIEMSKYFFLFFSLDITAYELRQQILHEVEKDEKFNLAAFVNKEEWIRKMRIDKTFCDHAFLCSAAHVLKRDIHILPVFVEDGHRNRNGTIIIETDQQPKEAPLYILHYSDDWFYNGHFQSIVRIEEEPEFED